MHAAKLLNWISKMLSAFGELYIHAEVWSSKLPLSRFRNVRRFADCAVHPIPRRYTSICPGESTIEAMCQTRFLADENS